MLLASRAEAAGFEKAVPWSGEYAGEGDATVPIVEGAQALAFNPAGLARAGVTKDGTTLPLELSLQFSPTFSRFRGPIATPQQLTSNIGFSPIGAAFVAWHPIPRLGIGGGGFVSSGLNTLYPNVDFRGENPQFDTLRPDFKAYLRVLELSVGVGVEPIDGLRIGASWRVSLVDAELDSANPVPSTTAGAPPTALVAAQLIQLTDQTFNGFRVGAQYSLPNDFLSFGVDWRTPVTFTAKGTVKGQFESGTPPNTPAAELGGGDATVSSQLPSQLAAGLAVKPVDPLRIVAEYDWTHYEVDQVLHINGALQSPAGPIPVPDIVLGWHNMQNVRVGADLALGCAVVRAGYVLTTQVTPEAHARATLAVPAIAHTITVGAGTKFAAGVRIDGALEYSFGSGHGVNELGIPGEFEERAIAAHLGAIYAF